MPSSTFFFLFRAYLNAKTRSLHCPDHIHQGSIAAGPTDSQCAICRSPSNVGNQLFCVTCGRHFHGSCVGLATGPGVRTAWQCAECKVCVTCRAPAAHQGSGSELALDRTKMLVCDTCEKSYHPFCVRPLLANVPKLGWKCKNCRVCGDCGSRTPGSGPSSRWHACFSVCDSCYQQRNKGVCCPLCGKAYRHSQREMSQCARCRKYVHTACDPEADRSLVQRKKESSPDGYEYYCPPCKLNPSPLVLPGGPAEPEMGTVPEDSSEAESSTPCPVTSVEDPPQWPSVEAAPPNVAVVAAAQRAGQKASAVQSAGKIARKRISGPSRPKGTGKNAFGAAASGAGGGGGGPFNRKASKVADFSRKRGPKPKMRGMFGAPGVGLQRPFNASGGDGSSSGAGRGDSSSSGPAGTNEGEPCLENKLILCSATDRFVVDQDTCAMCGSFGLDQEGRLIACAQCGQCYHPYCASVKVTKVILQKGWRCLDW